MEHLVGGTQEVDPIEWLNTLKTLHYHELRWIHDFRPIYIDLRWYEGSPWYYVDDYPTYTVDHHSPNYDQLCLVAGASPLQHLEAYHIIETQSMGYLSIVQRQEAVRGGDFLLFWHGDPMPDYWRQYIYSKTLVEDSYPDAIHWPE